MTEKKHHHTEQNIEEVNETKADAAQTPENAGPTQAEFDALKKQLEEAKAQAFEYKDGWVRSQADFQNYKKRIERDNELTYTSMKGDIIKKMLPVMDDLERALQNRPTDTGPWISGIELIHKKLQSILESEGIKRIEAEGQMFDPNFHEAISNEPSETVESGHVIAVVQNGYMLGDRVIRPAMVRVAQ